MVFSSFLFLFIFLPITILLYFVVREKYRNAVLLIASLVFYAWGEPKYIILLLISIVINFFFGLHVGKEDKHGRLFLTLDIIFNIGMLFVFKYFNFIADIYETASGNTLNIVEIALPIGISFYTFQILSYEIDVYRGEVEKQRNILNFSLYVSLFPQLIAGPIVRYADINQQINERSTSPELMYSGIARFIIGFSKKILIADQVAILVNASFSEGSHSVFLYWAGAIAYMLQIYFDFSAYSDMAIGLGRIFGFHFKENFNYPYAAGSVREFWRRWHISLSSWFRDYLYIPLGGNRKGPVRTYVNCLIVFALTGLWHGAGFNFLVWGLYYAFFVILERIIAGRITARIPGFLTRAYTLFVVLIGWVVFRADNLSSALDYLKGMFSFSAADITDLLIVLDYKCLFFIVVGIFLSVPHKKIQALQSKENIIYKLGLILLFVISICFMAGNGYSPFLYFRF